MKPQILRTYELCPDGVRIKVSWEKLVVNASVFIPCLNTGKAIQQVKELAKDRNWVITPIVSIEAGKLGVRIWRDL